MKHIAIIGMLAAFAPAFLLQGCSNPIKSKIKGNWHSTDGVTNLNIKEKQFSMEDEEDIPEDYVIKGDTIYTSYEGNEPLTHFIVQKLDNHYLRLLGPDSVVAEFNR